MKVKIGRFVRYVSAYDIAKIIFFWDEDRASEAGKKWAYKGPHKEPEVGEIYTLNFDRTRFSKFLDFIQSWRKRTVRVEIDRMDLYSADEVLAHIILPVLKRVKESKPGAPFVDNEDVPENLRANKPASDGNVDELWFDRWNYVLDEMIFAFESYFNDWEAQFHPDNEPNITLKLLESGDSQYVSDENYKIDLVGMTAYQERISNGLRLFGKYYQSIYV